MSEAHHRIVLVNPPSQCVDDDRLEPPLGLLYLAAVVRERALGDVLVCDLSGSPTEVEAEASINGLPEGTVYGITALCTNHLYARQIVTSLRRRNPRAYVVLGGANPSATPDVTLQDTGADAVVVGEGEDAFSRCVESVEAGQPLRGIVPAEPRTDPDHYPFPARDLVDLATYSRRLLGRPVLSLLSSRGCPHHCVFCNSVVMGGGAPVARYRCPDGIVAEIQSLREHHRNFRFNDDCFTGHPRLRELLGHLAELDIVFRIFARVEDLTAETCAALRRAGCIHVAIGLESLDPRNLQAMGKGLQANQADKVRLARASGLAVRAYFMVGLPYDTDEEIDRHFTAAAQLGLDEFSVYPLIPYPGTLLARDPGRFGYTIVNSDFQDYVQIGMNRRACYALRHRNFGPEDVARWKLRAEEILQRGGVVRSADSQLAV